MSVIWTHPPLEMRKGTSEGDYAIACISVRGDGSESVSIFRAPDYPSAQEKLASIIDEGDEGRIYDKEGVPI